MKALSLLVSNLLRSSFAQAGKHQIFRKPVPITHERRCLVFDQRRMSGNIFVLPLVAIPNLCRQPRYLPNINICIRATSKPAKAIFNITKQATANKNPRNNNHPEFLIYSETLP